MDYVCKVAGNLIINDINLELSYMEIIDLSADDFKASPQLREAIRTQKLELYQPSKHRTARRIKTLPPSRGQLPAKNEVSVEMSNNFKFSDSNHIKENLDNISKKMETLVNRIEFLIAKNTDTTNNVVELLKENFKKEENLDIDKFNYFLSKSLEYHTKIDDFLDKKNLDTDKKIDKLIDKLDQFITKGVSANLNDYGVIKSKTKSFDDEPMYVPKITTENIEKANIRAESIEQQGTDDILTKLREMKNKK